MFNKKIIIADNFPQGFESSNIQIPDGTRADFEQLGSSKTALVLKFQILLKAKVYSIILKKYFVRNISDFFKSLILPSRAQRAFKAGQMLIENGFLTPQTVAYGRKFLMTMEVTDSTPFYKMLGTLPAEKKKKMIEQFAQTIGKMHDKGIFHGDLRLGNILVKEKDENFEFYFLDNERTKKFDSIPWKLRVKNLVQVCMNRDAIGKQCQESFFKTYLAQLTKPVDAEELLKEVDFKTTKRLDEKN
ncbi:MAG: lipopolysaccharide kinase InaA family protein [Planctomycetaceae bacterium]|nr:lipopolysaccharide kinase InaA family protein [Planctomycetaceae bacterium]